MDRVMQQQARHAALEELERLERQRPGLEAQLSAAKAYVTRLEADRARLLGDVCTLRKALEVKA